MNEQSIREIFYMFNGFAKEGIITHFREEAIGTMNELHNNNTSIVTIPIKAYLELRDNRIFEQWYTTEVEHNGVKHTVLYQLYRNRIFEIWTIS
jgi:hypothetical protein